MATIKPTLILSANDNKTTAIPGPFTTPINLKTGALSLDVDQAVHYTIPSVRTTYQAANFAMNAPDGQILINGSDYTPKANSDGTTLDHHGAFVYLLNTTATTSKHIIAIGHTTHLDAATDDSLASFAADGTGAIGGGSADADSDADLTQLVDGATSNFDSSNKRLFSLRAGEWCFFPYDYTGDLYCQATAASQSLEVWIYHRTQ
tara:strand:+ start:1190 stop:1804 length:615 start_codon:yes stop_codon:yes gene_type:complete